MTDRSVVLLIDSLTKGHVDWLRPRIEQRGFKAAYLNLSAASEPGISISLPEIRIRVKGEAWQLDHRDLRSVWIGSRFPAGEGLTENPDFRAFAQDEWEAAVSNLFYLTRDIPWINPLDKDFVSGSKLHQLRLARDAGLDIPRTLVTLDPREFSEFLRSCPEGVAIKRLKDKPSLFRSDAGHLRLFTNRIRESDLARLPLDRIRAAPCFFQEYVPKNNELRVYVVGNRLFSVEIFSQLEKETEVDWRRYPRKQGSSGWEIDYDHWRCSAVDLPPTIQQACRQVVDSMGVRFAAVDLIRAKDGRYIFLEANNPAAWAWLERRTGLPISDAIVDLLVSDERSPDTPEAPGLSQTLSGLGRSL